VARENQDLYYEIQSLNSHTPAMLQKQMEVFEDYRKAIANCDREAFKSLMGKNRRYFDATY
jgi:prephenate dehydrogenase